MAKILSALFVCWAAVTLVIPSQATAQPAKETSTPPAQSSSASPPQSDDDDDVDELTYQWQNVKYSTDERHQIGYIVVILGLCACSSWLRRYKVSQRVDSQRGSL